MYFFKGKGSIPMLGHHNILVTQIQYRFPQAKVKKTSVHKVSEKLCTDQYIPVCNCDVHAHTHTDHTNTSFTTAFQGNIMAILLDGVRIWRNNQYGILPQNSKTV
jgi:hypothetical protein